MRYFLFYVFGFMFSYSLFAQETFPVNGVKDKNNNYSAFVNAVVFSDYQTKLENATLLIQNEKIIAVGKNIKLPPNTVVYDLKGLFVYPSFIDLYSDYGMPEVKKSERSGRGPQMESKTEGAYNWNQAIRAEISASEIFKANSKSAEDFRSAGFGAVMTHQKDGIARGTSALVTLGEGKENELLLSSKTAAHFSFNKGSSTQDYPSSLMGSIALLRQTYYDAQWYETAGKTTPVKELNLSLQALINNKTLPQVFESNNYLTSLRADKTGDEFGIQYIIKGKGDEYKNINAIKATNARFIIPINFPKAYDVEDPYDALLVSFEDMKEWELAPYNLYLLEKAGVEFALTASDNENKKDFYKNLKKAIKNGLSTQAALKSLTYNPAFFIGAENQIGSLKEGMLANFIITADTLGGKKFKIHENWIKGKRYEISKYEVLDVRGDYDLNINGWVYSLEVKGEAESPKGKIILQDTSKKAEVSINVTDKLISVTSEIKDDNIKGIVRLSGKVNFNSGSWDGQGQLPSGEWIKWNAIRKKPFKEKEGGEKNEKDSLPADSLVIPSLYFPLTAYGFKEVPFAKPTLIKNATVWTNESDGILKNTDVLLYGGKITAIGQSLDPAKHLPKAPTPFAIETIDASNMHLSPGIIDEHSHIAISQGVNEGGQAVSAEVRIGDVINPNDVNIYRQLAGGVTAVQQLHGSANPIGGQSSLIKLRWGKTAEEMKIENADGFIKFALGENVKQSNWGDFNTVRFPQSRMGVEQSFYDAFIRAREYEKKWNAYSSLPKKEKDKVLPPRKDLELDAVLEILNKKRFISCHSYVQSEINMLMHVADSMGFTVNTFTHILEGYKVADKMKKHGVGASTFSDWWAYKMEVNDAIPYNGAIMHNQGLVVAFNSDDAEMGRRLNQEAGKAVKYGAVSEEDALKFVTLNPARLLHLDNRMGSIKTGKDADLVLWTDNPLSVYSKVRQTYIDGIPYFDSERDLALREEMKTERAKLIAKMIKAKKEGEETRKPEKKEQKLYHCDTLEQE